MIAKKRLGVNPVRSLKCPRDVFKPLSSGLTKILSLIFERRTSNGIDPQALRERQFFQNALAGFKIRSLDKAVRLDKN